MAKTSVKKAVTSKESSPKKASSKKVALSSSEQIEKACYTALDKLKALNLDAQLQSDIEWCLGSYNNDKNPVGLYEMTQRAIEVFKSAQAKKTKGVTAKLISDLEKAVNSK